MTSTARSFFDALRPDANISVSEWADQHRILSRVSAGESGRWRTSRTPYLREIMDSFSDDSVERIVVVKGAQLGGTEALLNQLAYVIAVRPAPVLMVMPTVEMAKRLSKQRLRSLIESTPVLRGRVSDPRERDSGNTILGKDFLNGTLILTGANSGIGLRSMPAKIVLMDECDAFPASASGSAGSVGTIEEGDPVDLAIRRSDTFPDRKIVMVSTPTTESSSRIMLAFEETDKRYFFLPCPFCGEFQTLKWSCVIWPDGEPAKAFYRCEHCKSAIADHHKIKMLEAGEWRPTAPGDGKPRGYHLSGLCSPWQTWAKLAAEFLHAKVSPERLRTFTNCVLAEVWKMEHDKQLPADDLLSRCEPFTSDPLPEGVIFITGGADVQKDRIEIELVGWGRNEESWSLAYYQIPGDTVKPEVWTQLDQILRTSFRHPYGFAVAITATCVDAGFEQATVTRWCRERHARRIFATKSAAGNHPAWPRRVTKTDVGAPLWIIGADALKEAVYSRLKISDIGAGYCHFPFGRDIQYFEQLTSERVIVRYSKGFAQREWTKQPGARNEALDARCLNYAALMAMQTAGLKLNDYADGAERMRPVISPPPPSASPSSPSSRPQEPMHPLPREWQYAAGRQSGEIPAPLKRGAVRAKLSLLD